MLELQLKVDGPLEERIVGLLEDIKAALADNTTLTAEAAEIKAAVDSFKTEAAALNAKIAELQAALNAGGGVTQADLQEILNLATAKNQAIVDLFTPDANTNPTGPGE